MLREELIATIAEWEQGLDGTIEHDTPLITSGRLESLQLVRLVIWIEEKVGRPIDATVVDFAAEWDTVDAIVTFVEQGRDKG